MIDVLAVVAPVFAMIAIGYIFARAGFVPEALERLVTQLVFGVAIPTLLFRTMANITAPDVSPWGLWAAYFGGCAVSGAVTFVLVHRGLKAHVADAAIAAIGAAYSNTVLIGIPLIFSFFGETQSAVPLFIIISVHLPAMMVVGTLAIEWGSAGTTRTGAMALLTQTGKAVATNPIILGLVAGLLFRQTGWSIVAPVRMVIDLIAWVAVPAALVTMGVSLNRLGVTGQARITSVVLATKLVLHPLAVAFLALWVFELPQVWAAVAILFAAAPTGINVFLLASRYQIAVPATSAAIALGTAISIVTITLVSWGLNLQSG